MTKLGIELQTFRNSAQSPQLMAEESEKAVAGGRTRAPENDKQHNNSFTFLFCI